jgi:biopolymer transport protein ExbB
MIETIQSFLNSFGARWVLWLLTALSVMSMAIALERAWFFWRRRDDIDALLGELRGPLAQRDWHKAEMRLRASPSIEAAIALAGLKEIARSESAMAKAIASSTALCRAKAERRLGFLGAVGSNAPFIGLLGTVIGIIAAFDALGRATRDGASRIAPELVMSHIAEALVTTAIGLLVAIPAMIAFTFFQRVVKATAGRSEVLTNVVLACDDESQ